MSEHVIPELDRKGLRDFGFLFGGIIAILFGALFPWLLESQIPIWPWALCGLLVVVSLAAPMALRPLYKVWMRFGIFMSRIVTPLIMGIVFYLLITPVGLLRRIFAKDPLARSFDNSESYRVKSKKATADSLEKPY